MDGQCARGGPRPGRLLASSQPAGHVGGLALAGDSGGGGATERQNYANPTKNPANAGLLGAQERTLRQFCHYPAQGAFACFLLIYQALAPCLRLAIRRDKVPLPRSHYARNYAIIGAWRPSESAAPAGGLKSTRTGTGSLPRSRPSSRPPLGRSSARLSWAGNGCRTRPCVTPSGDTAARCPPSTRGSGGSWPGWAC